jgi:hypothetical protein
MEGGAELAIRELLWQVDGEREQAGWDDPPELAVVYREPVVAPGGLMAEVFMLRPFPGFRRVGAKLFEVYGDVSMPEVLGTLVRFVRTMPREMVEGEFEGGVGLVLVSEAWAVERYHEEEITDGRALIAGYTEAPPSEHPDRYEIRMVAACMADGTGAMLMHKRDGVADIMGGVRRGHRRHVAGADRAGPRRPR